MSPDSGEYFSLLTCRSIGGILSQCPFVGDFNLGDFCLVRNLFFVLNLFGNPIIPITVYFI